MLRIYVLYYSANPYAVRTGMAAQGRDARRLRVARKRADEHLRNASPRYAHCCTSVVAQGLTREADTSKVLCAEVEQYAFDDEAVEPDPRPGV